MATAEEAQLAVPENIPYPVLMPEGDEESPLAALLGTSDSIDRDLMPGTDFPTGGSTYWNFKDGSQPMELINGVIIHQHKRRGFWEPDQETGARPACISVDGERGYCRDHEIRERYGITNDCDTCPMAQYGTAVNDRGEVTGGQACSLRLDLYVITREHHIPLLVSLPSTSYKAMMRFLIGQATVGHGHWSYEVDLGLKTEKNRQNDPYSVVEPSIAGRLPGPLLGLVKSARNYWRGVVMRQGEAEIMAMATEYAESMMPNRNDEPFE